MKDKVFCRYSVVETATGALLTFGEKWKSVDKLNADYINDGTDGFIFKHTMYHRSLEIFGKRCVILLFALHFRRRGTHFCCLTELGFDIGLNGWYVAPYEYGNFSRALQHMGIVGAGLA